MSSTRRKAVEWHWRRESYPSDRSGFEAWQRERDSIMDDIYEVTGAEPKY